MRLEMYKGGGCVSRLSRIHPFHLEYTDMSTASSSGKVLVTTASGYLASACIEALLRGGYSVRGTVSTAYKGECLQKLFGDKFESVVVEDKRAVSI